MHSASRVRMRGYCGYSGDMRTLFLRLFLVTFAVSSASAFSLYDTAPTVGLPQSHAATYYASMRSGYDTNPGGSTVRKGRRGSAFVAANLSTSYADMESIDKLVYSLRAGGTYYIRNSETGRKYTSDCNLSTEFSHAFSAMSRYRCSISLTYRPEPGYDNGISAPGNTGDTFSWHISNTYNQSIDARWSWNASGSFSGTHYDSANRSYDDRQYYSANMGLHYRDSDLTTYSLSANMRDELRSYGADSTSLMANAGVYRALDVFSSVSLTVGVQCKSVAGKKLLSPTFDTGYRRRVTDGLSLDTFARYSNENINSYNVYDGTTFRRCSTWRAGAFGTYVLSPDVSYVFRVQGVYTDYGSSTGSGTQGSKRYSINPSLSMNYNFTPSLQGSLMAEYTYYMHSQGQKSHYSRMNYSAGLTYRF